MSSNYSIWLKRLASAFLFLCFISNDLQAVNIKGGGGNCSGGGGGGGGCDGADAGTDIESFHWYANAGKARIDRIPSFKAADATGIAEGRLSGGNRREFADIFEEQYNKNPISRIPVYLQISVLDITNDCLLYTSDAADD